MSDLPTIADLGAALRRGERTALDLADESLAAFAQHGTRTNAFIHLDPDRVRAEARARDEALAHGRDAGPLHGIPISIKDLIDVAGEVTTCASRAHPAERRRADAPVIARLRDAGAVLFGRTNLHEYALGTTSDESAYGPVRHPADPARSAGGSSGGSAAAVATGMGVASLGTDTGGSIRIPAAACGVVGLKPSAGDVPMQGIVPLSPSLDHAGPIARCVEDAARLWAVLAGQPAPPLDARPAGGIRLGRFAPYFEVMLDGAVREAWEHALDALRTGGVTITDLEVTENPFDGIPDAYVAIALAEAAHWHQQHVRAGAAAYTPGVAARLARGRTVTAVDYLTAQDRRLALRSALEQMFDRSGRLDGLLTPTLPITAPRLGTEEIAIDGAPRPLAIRAAMLKHTQPFNLTGHPAVSLPVPVDGLPVGLQVVGRCGQTATLLAVAATCERLLGMR